MAFYADAEQYCLPHITMILHWSSMFGDASDRKFGSPREPVTYLARPNVNGETLEGAHYRDGVFFSYHYSRLIRVAPAPLRLLLHERDP